MKQALLMKEVWVPSEAQFKFAEKVDIKTGAKQYILTGLMLPFDKISRNAVLYNTDSVKEKHKLLVGKPVMYNHKVDSNEMPRGHFTESWIEGDGWHYKADIDPQETDLIRKLERGDLRHVSIQLIGGKVMERLDAGKTYTEAWVDDIIEGSIVPAPGFLDTTASFAEALKIPQPGTEFAATGVITTFDTEQEARDFAKQHNLGIQQTLDGKWSVVGLEKTEKVDEEEVTKLLEELGLEGIQILKEYTHKLGDVLVVPFGISGVPIAKYVGQVGMITAQDEGTYTLLFQDGKKVKIDKKAVDIAA